MTDFPSTLPSAQVAGYEVAVTTGVTAVRFERGNTRQRRSTQTERHVLSLSLVLTVPQLWTWQLWANQYGYDWHHMDLTTSYSGFTLETAIPHYVRMIGDISLEMLSTEHILARYQVEMDLNTLPEGVTEATGDVIIGGSPSSPSSSNSIQAGTPASPSTDIIIAGSPGLTA